MALGKARDAQPILDDLEERDLIPEADTWAALAKLRKLQGDAAGQERATKRCVARAGKLAPQICPTPAAKPKTAAGA
jgi:predicted Zn-dependent protease